MKRRLWTVAATFSLAGVTFAPRVWAKGTVSVKEPTSDDDSSSSEDSKDDAKDGAASSETAAKPIDNSKSPNHGPRDKDNPQAKAAGDHVAMPPKMQGQGQATANEDHTVEHGDTLWDLSQKYLGNPWYWPKVWSYNPQIANPHWIYPGDQVKFYPGAAGDSEAPAQVQETEPKPADDEADLDDNGPMVSGGLYQVDKGTRASFRQDGFVTDRELEESGQIFKADAEPEMLSNYDKPYMRFKSTGDVKVGDRFFVYTTEREIHHPLTGANFGYLTRIVGTVRITRITDNQVVEGQVDQTWGEMYRGYYLAPYSEKLYRQVPPKAASADIKGVIVESSANLMHIGTWDVVFIDKGKRAGVEEGNTFNVVRRTDGASGSMTEPGQPGFYDPNLPEQIVGTIIAVDVKDDASTCMVLRSAHEFVPGDVIMSVKDLPKVSAR